MPPHEVDKYFGGKNNGRALAYISRFRNRHIGPFVSIDREIKQFGPSAPHTRFLQWRIRDMRRLLFTHVLSQHLCNTHLLATAFPNVFAGYHSAKITA